MKYGPFLKSFKLENFNIGDILPNSPGDERRGAATGEFDFMDEWYPIQVKQKDKVGRSESSGEKGEGRGEMR